MEIDEILTRGVAEIINQDNLKQKLESGKTLRIKFGIDPTDPHIHLGHAVPIRKLRAFQEMGHTVVFLIGDYTARIGDPSGKDKTRMSLSAEEVETNAKTYLDQAFKILIPDKTEVHRQSEWYEKFDLAKIMELASHASVSQIMEHETFRKRLEKGLPFMVHEELYPLLQGYDSVELKADVELGGTDQKFNLLMGRQIQKAYGLPEQDIVMMNYLIGTDGKEKMSKSLGNFIAIDENPTDMYGKIMSIPDHLITDYYKLATDVGTDALEIIEKELAGGKNPRDIKAELAKVIVESFYTAAQAEGAENAFNLVFSKRELPTEMPHQKVEEDEMLLADLIVKLDMAPSKSEARRLIEQGGVELDGQKIIEPNIKVTVEDNMVLKVGKYKFVKIEK